MSKIHGYGSYSYFATFFSIVAMLLCAVTTTTSGQEVFRSSRLFNSTLACTRGEDKTFHRVDCKKTDPLGLLALIAVKRLFYGTTPLTSECSIKAPYKNCCDKSPEKDCIFQSDFKLDYVAQKCSGSSACIFSGQPVMTNRGDCNTTIFPTITSYSFIEFECVSTSTVFDICSPNGFVKERREFYIDSNHYHTNSELKNTDCSCALYTPCGSTIQVEAVLVQLRKFNSTECVEELSFQDLKQSSNRTNYSCQDESEVNNVMLFNSESNAAVMRLDILKKHAGKVFVLVRSSNPNQNVTMKCGHRLSVTTWDSDFHCPGDMEMTTFVTDTTASSESQSSPGIPTGPDGQENVEGKTDEPIIIHKIDNDLHPGAIAGIVLAIIGIVLVALQLVFFLLRRKKAAGDPNLDAMHSDQTFSPPPEYEEVSHVYNNAALENFSTEAEPYYCTVIENYENLGAAAAEGTYSRAGLWKRLEVDLTNENWNDDKSPLELPAYPKEADYD